MKALRTYKLSDLQKMLSKTAAPETDLKSIIQELQSLDARVKSETSFFQLLDAAKMEIAYLSPSVEAVVGYPQLTWLNKGVQFNFDILHPEDRDLLRKAHELELSWFSELSPAQKTTCEFSNCFRVLHANGSSIKFFLKKYYLNIDDAGLPMLIFQICHDITSFKNDNTIVLEMNSRDEETNKKIQKKFIFYPPSHELKLSSREQEVLHFIQEGLTNRQIGEKLFISPDTVKVHRKKMLAKSGCRNIAELIFMVQQQNQIKA